LCAIDYWRDQIELMKKKAERLWERAAETEDYYSEEEMRKRE
jgi:hypothetical protein